MKIVHRDEESADKKLEVREKKSWSENDDILNPIEKDKHGHGIELHFIK